MDIVVVVEECDETSHFILRTLHFTLVNVHYSAEISNRDFIPGFAKVVDFIEESCKPSYFFVHSKLEFFSSMEAILL
jgi:hypothetical protein